MKNPTIHLNAKRVWLSFIVFILPLCIVAQSKNKQNEIVANFLKEKVETQDVNIEDISFVITSNHISSLSGAHHIYYRQTYNGLEILGTESSLHVKNDGSIFKSNDALLVKGIANKIDVSKNSFLDLSQALLVALSTKSNAPATINLKKISSQKTSGYDRYIDTGISTEDILIKKGYYHTGSTIIPIWEVIFSANKSSATWNYIIEASSGTILSEQDLTVSCAYENTHNHSTPHENSSDIREDEDKKVALPKEANLSLVDNASYRVYALPVESPLFGNRTLVNNPADAIASPFGWHDTNGVIGPEFTTTLGNNTRTYEDINDVNKPFDTDPSDDVVGAISNGGSSLIFDFAFDNTDTSGIPIYDLTNNSLDAAITNVFYWTNITHDIMHFYGFDEASGNFQTINYTGAGLGNDSVNAEVQDGSGTCNANFRTLPDGVNPRMQIFTCLTKDGAYDNLVTIHEIAHGISNRLTGGAANATALFNKEQMGEGWSDFYGYMLTMSASNFNQDRTVGTFLVGDDPNASGQDITGVRDAPYTADRNINGANQFTHADVNNFGGFFDPPHTWGQIWGTMLYDMTQNLMDAYGFDPDLYSGTGGNNIALALVTEALKLQPVNPGFVDGRDAILEADNLLYGGANQCLIWESFANRGLGFSASQGSTNDLSDNTNGFDLPPASLSLSYNDICLASGLTVIEGGIILGGTYSGSGVTDNGNGNDFTFDPVIAGLGTHTITYTYTDCNGVLVNVTDTIVVTEVLPEITNCPDVTLELGPDGTVIYDPYFTAPLDTQITLQGRSILDVPGQGGRVTYQVPGNFINEVVTVSFDWEFDGDPSANRLLCLVGTQRIDLQDFNGAAMQNGSFSIDVIPGEIFGFQFSNGGSNTGGTGIIKNFRPSFNDAFDISHWETISTASNGTAQFTGTLPPQLTTCGTITTSLSKSVFNCTDIGTTTPVTITITDSLGNSDSCLANVTINGGSYTTTTFAGGNWSNLPPTVTSLAIINDTYDSGLLGSIDACGCRVETGNDVIIRDGNYLKVTHDIVINGGALVVENEGGIVQVNENAKTINNGSISVTKITPMIEDSNFVIMSSPVTAEARDRVYGNSRKVFNIIPSNFVPFSIDLVTFPEFAGAENFLDDNNDYFVAVTGSTALPDAGIGQFVFPQPAPNVGQGSYTLTYTQNPTNQGTLNSGTITVPIHYNGPATVNNFNLLGNPYASAIDVTAFINANNAVNAVYYWDHITNPTSALPGAGTNNFSMNDISMRNALMGVAAVNGGIAPSQYMASGQGFGIKAEQAEMVNSTPVVFTNFMRVAGNNNDFRSSEIVTSSTFDKLWLNLTTSAYDDAISQAGIGFTDLATNGFDAGYDSKRLGTFLSLFTNLDGEYLAIQGREAFNTEMEIPLGFSTTVEEVATYTIAIDHFEGVELENTPIFIVDTFLNTTTNLKENPYTFTATKGIQPDRFIVVFQEREILNLEDQTIDENEITLFPNPTSNEVTLQYLGNTKLEEAIIINTKGQIVKQIDLDGFNKTKQLNIQKLSTGIYFIQIVFEGQLVIKKLIIK